jgi:hypothetical protein
MTNHFLNLPSSQAGWLSLALVGSFAGFMALFFVGLSAGVGPDNPEDFFDNPYLAITLLLAAGSGILAGAVAGWALAFTGERSVLVVAALLGGLFVLGFSVLEVVGHEEPRGSDSSPATGGNSHFNLSAIDAGPERVRVSFDYTYQNDPEDKAITGLAVTPLGSDGGPLGGYDPVEAPVARGTHHVSLVLDFSEEQVQELAGFSVCFTGSDEPDLGCRTVDYEAE